MGLGSEVAHKEYPRYVQLDRKPLAHFDQETKNNHQRIQYCYFHKI